MQSTQQGFQHIKFDMKNEELFSRSNRAKLPQISGRLSLDNRLENKSTKKPEQRINIVKNVDIGNYNPQSSSQGVGKKTTSEKPNILENNNGFQHTFYVRRKTNKMY